MSTPARASARFAFTDPNGRQAVCGIEMIPLADGHTAVIATELAGNPGMSVTNAAEHVASAVCRQFAIDPHRLVWVEHYDGGSYCDHEREETFDRVTFHHVRPMEPVIFSVPPGGG